MRLTCSVKTEALGPCGRADPDAKRQLMCWVPPQAGYARPSPSSSASHDVLLLLRREYELPKPKRNTEEPARIELPPFHDYHQVHRRERAAAQVARTSQDNALALGYVAPLSTVEPRRRKEATNEHIFRSFESAVCSSYTGARVRHGRSAVAVDKEPPTRPVPARIALHARPGPEWRKGVKI